MFLFLLEKTIKSFESVTSLITNVFSIFSFDNTTKMPSAGGWKKAFKQTSHPYSRPKPIPTPSSLPAIPQTKPQYDTAKSQQQEAYSLNNLSHNEKTSLSLFLILLDPKV